ncbi:PRKCA-binding protein-like [Panonychus citri]|uniref:PRKCA-binding protein-like n=1 Tax=Panonychus citri TaxID=50023 RepID=UPI0023076B78|nr:PRKCA-binding protein-like [Panonychus citri]
MDMPGGLTSDGSSVFGFTQYHLLPENDPDLDDDIWLDSMIEDRRGMKVTSGTVTLEKDSRNMIGVSIGGGAPNCPCIYIVQIFDNTPVACEGTLESGDEIVGVNGVSVKGKTKIEVAQMIKESTGSVTFNYNKLHADPKQGKTLDIILKKVKHRICEKMSSDTADALGLSRAMLCNDSLIRKLEELELMELMYKGIIERTRDLLKAHLEVCYVYKAFGDLFTEIGVKDINPESSRAFIQFGEVHRSLEKQGTTMIRQMKPLVEDLNTFLNKAVPDTRLTIKKYGDVKMEYLSYCLKVKEMDDEEVDCTTVHYPLYRVETGNYDYRLVLRCRQEARKRFASLRSDVLVKLELLDSRHVQDIVSALQRLNLLMSNLHMEYHRLFEDHRSFPVELALSANCSFNLPEDISSDSNEESEYCEDNFHQQNQQNIDLLTETSSNFVQ